MTKLHKLTLLGLMSLGLTTVSSYGAVYDFSYTSPEDPGTRVTGSLVGTVSPLNPDVVDVSSVLSLIYSGPADISLNQAGVAPTLMIPIVPLSASDVGYGLTTPVVSFDGEQNAFIFGNANVTEARTTAFFGMYIVYGGVEMYAEMNVVGANNVQLIYMNDGIPISDVSDYWSLTLAPGVPDGGLTIAMLGTAMSGLAFLRRKF
jgi:hypothetical protein